MSKLLIFLTFPCCRESKVRSKVVFQAEIFSIESGSRLFAGVVQTQIGASEDDEKSLALFCGDVTVCGFRGAFASRYLE